MDPNLSSVARYSPNLNPTLGNSSDNSRPNSTGIIGEQSKPKVNTNGSRINNAADQLSSGDNLDPPLASTDELELSANDPGTSSRSVSAKRSISFPDSPTTLESIKRP